MSPDVAATLRSAPLTYADVGATAGEMPRGWPSLRRRRRLRHRDFDAAARALMTWQVQARSGMAVDASEPRIQLGTVVQMRLGPGRFTITIPCRVVRVVEEPDRVGFAYGTLPGHPERGEEAFYVERDPDGSVWVRIVAFSRAGRWFSRAGAPLARLVQIAITARYLRALDRL